MEPKEPGHILNTNGSMTTPAESLLQESRGVAQSFLSPKALVRIGAWNVRTMHKTSKCAQVIKEMNNYKIDIFGISECGWTGAVRQTTWDETIILHSNGVALTINKRHAKTLIIWEPVSDRLLRAWLVSKLQTYHHTRICAHKLGR